MRTAWCTLIVGLVFACPVTRGQVRPQKSRAIYVKIKGPERSATKLRASLADAALEKDLTLVDNRHEAASEVKITIKERSTEKPLYAELISATLVSRDGKSMTVYSCKKVTDGKGYSTITRKSGKTGVIKSVPAGSRIFVQEPSGFSSAGLVQDVKEQITRGGLEIGMSGEDADFILKDIKLTKASFRGTAVEASVESVLSPAHGPRMDLSSSIIVYTSIQEPIAPQAEACRDSIRHVADDSSVSYQQIALTDIALISQRIK